VTRVPSTWRRTFFLIWAAQAFSLVGSAAAQFAITWWLAAGTGSAMTLALASLAGFLPPALLGPFAGVWIDRRSRRAVMIAADLFIAAGSAVLAVALLAGRAETWLVYAVLLQRAVGSVFHAPALQAAIPMLVPERELVRTGALTQLLQSASFLLAPVLGTSLLVGGSLAAVLAVDVGGALVAAAILARVEIPDPPRRTEPPHVWRELREGVRALVAHRDLVAASTPIFVTCLVYVPLASFFPLMVRERFDGTAWHAALVEVLFAGGMMASSLLLGAWGGGRDRLRLALLGNALLGTALAAAGLFPPSAFAAFAAACAVMGAAGNLFEVPYFAHVQATVAPEALGRVMALLMSTISLSIPCGLLVAGPVAERIGVARWFLCAGTVIVLSSAAGFLVRRRCTGGAG
jgi:DHA3 family macrolide efflux protein-like MFS transporter